MSVKKKIKKKNGMMSKPELAKGRKRGEYVIGQDGFMIFIPQV